MRKRPGEGSFQAASCWRCNHRFTGRQVLRDGILRSRTERAGGPYRLYLCPGCTSENLCERTPRGRWFASPNHRFSILDYLFSQVLDPAGAETALEALTWLRENEDRRRYFFELDGDRRYSSRSLWVRWFAARRDAGEPRETPRRGPRASGGSTRAPGSAPPPRRAPRIVTPYEILGLAPGAGDGEIREAFHRLAVLYHPDKVHHLGEDFERVAKQKFQELKDAYEALLRARR